MLFVSFSLTLQCSTGGYTDKNIELTFIFLTKSLFPIVVVVDVVNCVDFRNFRRPSNALRLSSASTDIGAAGVSESSAHGIGDGTSSPSFAAAAAFRGGARGEVSQAKEPPPVEVEAKQINRLVIDRYEKWGGGRYATSG